VQQVTSNLPSEYADLPVSDYSGSLIIPGFNDLHIHAPQYPIAGLGFDYELLPWLERYTFPGRGEFRRPGDNAALVQALPEQALVRGNPAIQRVCDAARSSPRLS
jgi:cytosine/adenosine deaminase-related metal-dependent hydrolase